MQRCPVCRANLKDRHRCPRCHTDLSPIFRALKESRDSCDKALAAAAGEDFEEMFQSASRAISLRATRRHLRLLATAALLTGRNQLALSLWKSWFMVSGP
jgi:hypothetical protein